MALATSAMRLAGAYAEGGLPQRAISRTTFKCTVPFSTLHFPRRYRTGPRGLQS
jgi:hypothetical protein